MEKVRFACPKCQTLMQTGVEKVGYDVACPHCFHRFRLVESESPESTDNGKSKINLGAMVDGNVQNSLANESTMPPKNSPAFGNLNAPISSPAASPPANRNPYSAPVLGPAIETPANAGFQCPYCQTTNPPKWKSEVSQTGWIMFAVLLVTTCVGCLVGLFVRDKYRVCSKCKIRLS